MGSGIVGVLGAQGCGKTALTRALSGEETDRLPEEKERGLSIEPGFAALLLANGKQISLADLPGHERYARHLLAGLAGVSAVIMVVAASQGVTPQTGEHLAICRFLGIQQGCLVITGSDQAEPDLLAMVVDEARDVARGSFLHRAPVFPVSTINAEGLEPLREWLAGIATSRSEATGGGPFRLGVDRLFTLPDGGLVATGAVLAGKVCQGDALLLYPRALSVHVDGLQEHHREVTVACPGTRVALHLQGVDETMIERGDVLATPGSLAPSSILDVDFTALASHPRPFVNRTAVRVHFGAAEIAGHIVLLETEELASGERAAAQLFLEEPVGAWPGDRFLVRSNSPPAILGGGVVYNGVAARRKRHGQAEIFTHYRRGDMEQIALTHVRESGFQGLAIADLALRLGISERRARKVIETPLSTRLLYLAGGGRPQLIARETFEAMKERTVRLLASFHDDFPEREGLSVEELRRRVYGGMEPTLMRLILDDLAKGGTAQVAEEAVRLSPGRPLSSRLREWLGHELELCYLDAALTPPTLREVALRFPRQGVEILREMLDSLALTGMLCRVSDDLYFHHEPLDAFQESIVHHLQEQGETSIQEFKALAGVTRKFLVPALEHLDAIGVTKRLGNGNRVLCADAHQAIGTGIKQVFSKDAINPH